MDEDKVGRMFMDAGKDSLSDAILALGVALGTESWGDHGDSHIYEEDGKLSQQYIDSAKIVLKLLHKFGYDATEEPPATTAGVDVPEWYDADLYPLASSLVPDDKTEENKK